MSADAPLGRLWRRVASGPSPLGSGLPRVGVVTGENFIIGLAAEKLLAVEIETKPAFRVGNAQSLGLKPSVVWDSAADGERFLGLADTSGPTAYTVVLNWQAGLKN